MSSMMSSIDRCRLRMPWRSLVFAILLAAGISASFRQAAADDAIVTMVADKTVVEVGRTRMLAFRLAAPSSQDAVLAVVVENPSLVDVLLPPTVLKGEVLGYLRMRGVAQGRTQLMIAGATMTLDVIPPRVADDVAKRPVIVGPTDGARVWYSVEVGVEVGSAGLDVGAKHGLRLSTGAVLAPVRVSDALWGPALRLLYRLDVSQLAAGPLTLTPWFIRPNGTECVGDAVHVVVIKPERDRMMMMEAEEQRDVKRPQRFGDALLNVATDREASGHQMVPMPSSDPAACFPIHIESGGWYQVVARVRGTFAGGALPTIGLIIDGGATPVTNARLLDEGWHRIALGVPVWLDAGERIITPYFLNDFYAPGVPADRNLFLDNIEIVRLGEVPTTEGSAPNMVANVRVARQALRVAFTEPFHERLFTGTCEIGGLVVWPGMERRPAPKVTLKVNGESVWTQRSAAPKWWLDPAWMSKGVNALQLVAELGTEQTVASPVQIVTWNPPLGWRSRKPNLFCRYTVRDEAWEQDLQKNIVADPECPEKVIARFNAPGEAVLELPESLQGSFLIWVEGKGEAFEGPPNAELALEANGSIRKLGDVALGPWWSTYQVARVGVLPRGKKLLRIAYRNDKYEPGKGDRNLLLQGVILLGVPTAVDSIAPMVTVAYPPAGHQVWQVDAVVAEAVDDSIVSWVELVVDGKPTGIRVDTLGRSGRVVLPLIARQLEPGEHQLVVRAADGSGQIGSSEARSIVVLAEAPARLGPYRRAVHLLNRLAFGPDPDQLALVLTRGELPWVEDRLQRGLDDPGDAAAFGSAKTLFANDDGEYDIMGRDAHHALLTTNPLRMRFVRWVDNHFSTWIRKTGGRSEWEERQRYSRLGCSSFPDLLHASATSPCMLQYLDQQYSFARSMNENYARELCELHTVGVHGGYNQADVTALASLLTGWTFSDEGDGHSGGFLLNRRIWRFDPTLSDGRPQTFFGMRFARAAPQARFDRACMTFELLAAHPSTARFICGKLVSHYIRHPAPDSLVDELAQLFIETHGDFKALITAMVSHSAFWDDGLEEKLATPFDFATRLSRACGVRLPWQVIELCQRSGAGLYDRSTPDGYQEEDRAWSSTNAMLQRWKFSRDAGWALASVLPKSLRWNDAAVTAEERQLLIDLAAGRLIGRVLSESSNAAALRVLAACTGDRNALAMQAVQIVAQLPEANLR
jgi:hypothetical protein